MSLVICGSLHTSVSHWFGLLFTFRYLDCLVKVIMAYVMKQDFRDEAGDRTQSRITLPIMFPEWSRRVTLALILAWSLGLVYFFSWTFGKFCSTLFACLGIYLALRIYVQRTEHEDKISLRIYMVRCWYHLYGTI